MKIQFPLSFSGISIWLAAMAIILLITEAFVSPYYGQTSILIQKGRLRKAALVLGILFILTIIMQILLKVAPF